MDGPLSAVESNDAVLDRRRRLRPARDPSAEARDVVRRSFPVEEYEPKNTTVWEEVYARFVKISDIPRTT